MPFLFYLLFHCLIPHHFCTVNSFGTLTRWGLRYWQMIVFYSLYLPLNANTQKIVIEIINYNMLLYSNNFPLVAFINQSASSVCQKVPYSYQVTFLNARYQLLLTLKQSSRAFHLQSNVNNNYLLMFLQLLLHESLWSGDKKQK